MKKLNGQVVSGIAAVLLTTASVQAEPPGDSAAFRPPAVPLVANNPYLSIWSMADRLTDDTTRHWTRREHPLFSLIRIDGKAFRLMGTVPKDVPAMKQVGVRVLPTRSIYDYDDGHVHVTLTFMTPALPDDLDVLARPLTYLSWDVRSVDGIAHVVSIYDSTSGLLAVNEPGQKVQWDRPATTGMTAMRVGTVDQTLLRPAGDDTRIDWGYAYVAAPARESQGATRLKRGHARTFRPPGCPAEEDDTRRRARPTTIRRAWRLPSTWARLVGRPCRGI